MGSVPPELSLDFRRTFVPKTISGLLKEASMIGNVSERLSKLDDFVKRLEDEIRKIDAFKRELPLCMFLLNDAIRALKEDAMQCAAPNIQPVLEEFIPLKKDCDKSTGGPNTNKKEKDCLDKKNWMSSVQLWNTDNCQQHPSSDFPYDRKQVSEIHSKRNEAENGIENEDPFQTCRDRTGARAFMPFKAAYPAFSVTPVRKEDKEELPVHGLSLLTPGIKNPKEESTSSGSRSNCGREVSFSTANAQSNMRTPPQQPTSRNQKRCWTPELHRRFVNALEQLGGSQVATPKQIRELMQVDGLTNDEVKSHLEVTSADWIFLITSLCLEILSAAFDQASSPSKPRYALIGMLLAISAVLTCIWELIHRVKRERVVFRRWGMLWWFYYPHSHNMLFGTFPDICGLLVAISQCMCSAVQYVYLRRQAENPIKLSVLPVIFVICLAGSTFIRNSSYTRDETLEHIA